MRCLPTVLLWAAVAAPACAQESMELVQDQDSVRASISGRPVLKYRFGNVEFKPYVSGLFSPAGVQVLRDSPADHKHHHALMFAVNADGVEFWGPEGEKCGRQVNAGLAGCQSVIHDGRGAGWFVQQLDWTAPDGRKLVCEQRTVRIHTAPGQDATLVTWQSVLCPAAGLESVELSGRNYLGLGVRFVQSMDSGSTMLAADNVPPEPDGKSHVMYPTRWIACSGSADGHPVTVALFDHPDNPRHPARMFTMTKAFAYLSATLGLDKQTLPLRTGQPLDLRYGVAVFDGPADAARIDALYRRWVAEAKAAGSGSLKVGSRKQSPRRMIAITGIHPVTRRPLSPCLPRSAWV